MTRTTYVASAALAVYAVALVVALLAPTSTDQAGMVSWLGGVLGELGAPGPLTRFDHLEVLMNALIVAPVSFLGSVVRPSLGWRSWTALGFATSVAVELIQWQLLPDRHASLSDVVANTLGALLGATAFLAVRRAPALRGW